MQREGGGTLLFRYYDPRVLRIFLPTCTPAELREFFGPLSRLYAEAEGGQELLEFSQAAGKLAVRQHAVIEHA